VVHSLHVVSSLKNVGSSPTIQHTPWRGDQICLTQCESSGLKFLMVRSVARNIITNVRGKRFYFFYVTIKYVYFDKYVFFFICGGLDVAS
jgi:hypothetical protein